MSLLFVIPHLTRIHYYAILSVVCFAFAVGIPVSGYHEYVLWVHSSTEPEEITLNDLIARGKPGNAYLLVSDFRIVDDVATVRAVKDNRLCQIWVPVVPADEPTPNGNPTAAIRAFIYSNNVREEDGILTRFQQPTMRVVVSRNAYRPKLDDCPILNRDYPATDPKTALILDCDWVPPSKDSLLSTLAVIVCLVLIGTWSSYGISKEHLKNKAWEAMENERFDRRHEERKKRRR